MIEKRPTNPAGLTAREIEVARLLAEGETIKRAAVRLGISNKTAEFHSLNAKNKIGTNSVVILTHYAIATGLTGLRCWAILVVAIIACVLSVEAAPKKRNAASPPVPKIPIKKPVAAKPAAAVQSPKAASQVMGLKMLIIVPQNTNGFYEFGWTRGRYGTNITFISNVTTRATMWVGTNNNATWKGFPPGQTNTFVAFNELGISAPLTLAAKTNRSGITPSSRPYTYNFYWTNGTLFRTSNFKNWTPVANQSPATVTNAGNESAFFRATASNVRGPVLDKTLLAWPSKKGQTNRLQREINTTTQSYADELGFTATNTGTHLTLTTNTGRWRVLQD